MPDRSQPDVNLTKSLIVVSNADNVSPVTLWADPTTHALVTSGGGGGSGGTQYTDGATAVAHPVGTQPVFVNGSNVVTAVSTTNPLPITGSLSVGGTTDEAAFTAGTSTFTSSGGVFNDSVAALTTGQQGTERLTANRAVHSNLRSAAGTEIGTTANPIIAQSGDGTNNVNTLKSDGTAAGQNSQLTAGTYLSVAYTTTTVQAVGSTDAGNYRYVSVQINTQGGSSTVTFQASNDNATWVSVALMPVGFTQGNASTGSTGTGIWSGGVTARYFRLNVTGIASGTTAGTIVFSTLPTTPIDFGVAANLNQINAVTLLAGNGLTGTGSPRVTIASDNTAFSVNAIESGTWNVGSSTATGSAVPANAMYAGVNARTSLPTAATAGNLTGLSSDKFGRVMTIEGTIRDLVGTQTTTIAASTAETTIVTAAASTFNDITLITVANTSATAVRVDFRDTTAGSVLFPLYVPAGDTRGFSVQRPIPQTTVNTNWTAQCSASVTDVRIYVEFDKNA